MKKLKVIALTAGLLLLLAGCDMNRAPDGPLEEWAAEEFGDDILNGLDALENMGRPGAPFENNLESARAYLLGQLEEKYGIEFVVVGDESLVNYGPLAGATYTCGAAPADAPDRVITAGMCGTTTRCTSSRRRRKRRCWPCAGRRTTCWTSGLT